MKIIVQHKDGPSEVLTLTEPLTLLRGERLNRIVTSTGAEHWFDLDGYYDGWGMAVNIAAEDDGPDLPKEAKEFIQAVEIDREFLPEDSQ